MPVVHGLSIAALTQLLESLLNVDVAKLNEISPNLLNSVSLLLKEVALCKSAAADEHVNRTVSEKTASGSNEQTKALTKNLDNTKTNTESLSTSLLRTESPLSNKATPEESFNPTLIKHSAKEFRGTTNNKDPTFQSETKPQQQLTQPSQERNPVKEITSEKELKAEMEACRKESKMLIMDFYSYSCKPCVKAMPRYVAHAKKHPEISWVKLNIDVIERKLRDKWDVKKIPRFISWKDGNVVAECGTGTPVFNTSLALSDFVDFVLKRNTVEEPTFALDMDF